jgi:hypothetical protein
MPGYHYRENGALARLGVKADAPTKELGKLLDDVKPKANSLMSSRFRAVRLSELLENERRHLSRNSNSRVGNFEFDTLPLGDKADRNCDMTLMRKLDGVINEILQNLF